MSDSWLNLGEALIVLDLAVIVFVGLLGVILDAIIELLTEVLWSTLLKLTEPSFDVFHSFIDDVLEGHLRAYQVVDGTHKEREDTNAHKLDDHLNEILNWRISLEITISYGRQSGNDPIEGDSVDLPPFLVINFDLSVSLTIVEPAAVGYRAHIDPKATEQVDGRKQVNDQVDTIACLFYTAFIQTGFGKDDPD